MLITTSFGHSSSSPTAVVYRGAGSPHAVSAPPTVRAAKADRVENTQHTLYPSTAAWAAVGIVPPCEPYPHASIVPSARRATNANSFEYTFSTVPTARRRAVAYGTSPPAPAAPHAATPPASRTAAKATSFE